jgi:hypothetical protein
MKDYALTSLIRRVLAAKTKGAAVEIVGNVGDEYSPIIGEILARLSFGRTKSQNSLLHEWYAEIARWRGDVSALDVKAECHRDLGLHIRLRDPQFDWVWKHTGELMDPEQQAKLLVSGCLKFSSEMSVKELSEYMDEISRFYEAKGVRLTRPDE